MRMRDMQADDGDQLTSDSVGERTPRRGSLKSTLGSGGLFSSFKGKSTRRGSAVTFDLPDDSDEEERECRDFRRCCGARRMSAPELPPIRDRPDSRANRGSSGSVTDKASFYQRFKNGRLPRNHSDGSIKVHLTRSPHSRSSSSVNSNPSGQPGYLSSKTRSNGGTDKSTGSTTKLRTLFERKPTGESSSANRHSRSGFSSQSTGKGSAMGRLGTENELNINEEIIPIESLGKGKYLLRRNRSEIQLSGLTQLITTNNNDKILLENKPEKTKSKPRNGFPFNKLKRFNSTPTINRSTTTLDDTKEVLKSKDLENIESESERERHRLARIYEWLRGIEFDAEEPPEQVIEYADEPPQTDTAVHIVFNED